MDLATKLLQWYDAYGRQLPWREYRDAYVIWVSEIMLQQTRVEVVKEYFRRWMERFPTAEILAAAPEEEVLRYWQGLGYYNRARNLQQGVREVVADYGGQVPRTRAEVEGLTGIGEYTAGAILSIAYNQPEPAVDGNVLRVFSRLYALTEDIAKSAAKRKVTALVKDNLPAKRPGDFNQAIMDLGASICIPKNPRCEECPLTEFCQARRQGRELELPLRSINKAPQQVQVTAAVIGSEDNMAYLLRLRPAKGLLARMWEFPAVETGQEEEGLPALQNYFAARGAEFFPQPEPLLSLVHTFSHRQWYLRFYAGKLMGTLKKESALSWQDTSCWAKLVFAGPHAKLAAKLQKEGSAPKEDISR